MKGVTAAAHHTDPLHTRKTVLTIATSHVQALFTTSSILVSCGSRARLCVYHACSSSRVSAAPGLVQVSLAAQTSQYTTVQRSLWRAPLLTRKRRDIMAALAASISTASAMSSSTRTMSGISRSATAVCPARRPQPRKVSTSALGLSNIAVTTVLAGAAAWYLAGRESEMQKEQEAGEREACPRCGGSGVEECMCTRWNDGDVGCASCSKTGYMKCRSCRGGGTAVPIKVSIRKTEL